MGTTKVNRFTHQLIHDLNLLLKETNKIRVQSENLKILIEQYKDHSNVGRINLEFNKGDS